MDVVEINYKDDHLFMIINNSETELFALVTEKDKFKGKTEEEILVSFIRSDKNEVISLELEINGMNFTAIKQ